MLTTLKIGYLKVEQDGNERVLYFAISGGFAEVLPTGVKIFAETAEAACRDRCEPRPRSQRTRDATPARRPQAMGFGSRPRRTGARDEPVGGGGEGDEIRSCRR